MKPEDASNVTSLEEFRLKEAAKSISITSVLDDELFEEGFIDYAPDGVSDLMAFMQGLADDVNVSNMELAIPLGVTFKVKGNLVFDAEGDVTINGQTINLQGLVDQLGNSICRLKHVPYSKSQAFHAAKARMHPNRRKK